MMEAKTTIDQREPPFTSEQFAHLGEGAIAYVKPMRSEEVTKLYPGAPDVPPGVTLFALLSAAGAPIVLAGSLEGAAATAWENKLRTVSLH